MNIIGIAGRLNSGKSTVADILNSRHGFVEVACADLLKRWAMEAWGFTAAQLWGPSEMRETPLEGWKGEHAWNDGFALWRCLRCDQTVANKSSALPCKLTARFALQRLGTECARSIDPDVWINNAVDIAKLLLKNRIRYTRTGGISPGGTNIEERVPRGVVISDVRFENEAKAIVEAGGVVWRILRNVEYLTAPAAHASERLEISPELFARTIVNDGTIEELATKVEEALR